MDTECDDVTKVLLLLQGHTEYTDAQDIYMSIIRVFAKHYKHKYGPLEINKVHEQYVKRNTLMRQSNTKHT